MIRVENLNIHFEDTTAVSNFSFNFCEGIIYGLVGQNGAGKSTMLRGMTGLITEFDGKVSYDDIDLVSGRQSVKKTIGYTPEEALLLPYLTGREYLELTAVLRKIPNSTDDLNELLLNLGLKKFENNIIDEYSHGMQKKLSLAAAFVGSPKYILIDEGLNGLDPQGLSYASKKLHDLAHKQHTIIIASHDLELVADLCSHIIVLHEGKAIKEYTETDIKEFKTVDGKSLRQHFQELLEDFPGRILPDHQE